MQKQDSTGTTKHVWDGQKILLETDGSNIIQVVYTLEPEHYGNLISQRRSGTTSFYLFDGLGSTRQLVGSTGSVTDSYLYDSFGKCSLRAERRLTHSSTWGKLVITGVPTWFIATCERGITIRRVEDSSARIRSPNVATLPRTAIAVMTRHR